MHYQNYLSIVQNKYLSTEDHIYALVRTDLPDTEDSFLIGKVLRTMNGSMPYVLNLYTLINQCSIYMKMCKISLSNSLTMQRIIIP